MCLLLDREESKVADALVDGLLLLVGGDGLEDVVYDPVDHVLLSDATVHIGGLHLVVQTPLDLGKESKVYMEYQATK